MSIKIKPLNQDHINQANNNSFGGKRGDLTANDYKIYCDKVISWELSERKTQKILEKLHGYFSRILSLDAQHVSVAVAGGSNYNARRLDKSDKILQTSTDFVEWFEDLEQQATKNPYNRIEWLTKEIIWGVSGGYAVNQQWKEIAGRDREAFESLYQKLVGKFGEFKKTTIPYKIYNKLIEVEQITQAPIYVDEDICAYEELGKICIEFRMKPERQMIAALKSRRFVWIPAHELWRADSTPELLEWVGTIAERYEDYI